MTDNIIRVTQSHPYPGRSLEVETSLLPVARVWEEAKPNSEWHGEPLHWLSQAQTTVGKTQEAHANNVAARQMLKKSTLPTHQRLVANNQ